nr:latent membrane protein 1 [Vector ZsGLMP1M81-2]
MERDLERGPPGPPRPPLGPPLSSSIGLALLLLLLALLFWLYIVMSNWTGGALLVLYSFALMLIIIILIIFIFRRDLLCPLGGLGLLLLMITLLLIALWNLHGQALYLGIVLFIFGCLLVLGLWIYFLEILWRLVPPSGSFWPSS